MSNLHTIQLSELEMMEDGDAIERVEGTVVAAYQPEKRGQYEKQNLYVRDNSIGDGRVMLSIGAPEKFVDPEEVKGKRIVVEAKKQTSGQNAGKTTGIKWKIERSRDGQRTFPKIWVTSTATIRIGATAPTGPVYDDRASNRNTANTNEAMNGLNEKQLAERFASIITLTTEELVKAGYSEKEARSAAAHAPEWAALWWFGQKSTVPCSGSVSVDWKSLKHPNKNVDKTLGELDNDSLIKLVVWAFGKDEVKEDLKQVHDALVGPVFESLGDDPCGLLMAYAQLLDYSDDVCNNAFDHIGDEEAFKLLKAGKDEIKKALDAAAPSGDDAEEEEFEDFDD